MNRSTPRGNWHCLTLVEIMIVVIVILIIVSFMLGGVIRSQQVARYTRWLAYSNDLAKDPDVHAYYTFQEGNGAYLQNVAMGNPSDIDYRPSDFDGEIHGAEWRPNEGRWIGKWGLYFDGIDDYVALKLQAAKGEYDAVTVMAWVRPARAVDQVIVSLDGQEVWELSTGALGGDLTFDWTTTDESGATARLRSPARYGAGKWYLVVAWYNREGVIQDSKVFVNAERVAYDKKHTGMALGAGAARDRTFGFIGVDSAASAANGTHGNRFFSGMIDELIIFKRALSEQEIADFHKMGTP